MIVFMPNGKVPRGLDAWLLRFSVISKASRAMKYDFHSIILGHKRTALVLD
jgi:hypothetical protein